MAGDDTAKQECTKDGAQDSLRIIAGETKERYLEAVSTSIAGLQKALPNLEYVIERNKAFDYESAILKLCNGIQNILYLLTFRREPGDKRGIPELNAINPPDASEGIGMETKYSGFPNSEWIRILYVLKNDMPSLRQELRHKKDVMDSLVRTMFAEKRISRDEQEMLIRQKYFDELAQLELPPRVSGQRAKVSESDESVIVSSIFHKLSLKDNMFTLYSATYSVEQQVWRDLAKGRKELDHFIDASTEQNAYYAFLFLSDFDKRLRPKTVDKLVIGPFLCKETQHNKPLAEVFKTMDFPYVLNVKFEVVKSEKSLDSAELASDMKLYQYVICPRQIKKAMEYMFKLTKETFRYSSEVIGVTDKGDIVA